MYLLVFGAGSDAAHGQAPLPYRPCNIEPVRDPSLQLAWRIHAATVGHPTKHSQYGFAASRPRCTNSACDLVESLSREVKCGPDERTNRRRLSISRPSYKRTAPLDNARQTPIPERSPD